MKGRKNVSLLVLGAYFIFAGTVFLSHAFYPRMEQVLKKQVYLKSQEKIPAIEKKMASIDFIRGDKRREVAIQYAALKKVVDHFKETNVGHLSFLAILISIFGLLIGVVYIAIGTGLIKKFFWTPSLISVGLVLLGVYAGLYFLSANGDIKYFDEVAVKVWQISSTFSTMKGVSAHINLARSFTEYLFFRTVVFIGVLMGFYLLPLLYFLQIQTQYPGLFKKE